MNLGEFLHQHIPTDGAWRMISLSKSEGASAPVDLLAYRLDGEGSTVRATYTQPVDNPVDNPLSFP